MATKSVTLELAEVLRIQERLLVGLSAFAEIDRVHSLALSAPQHRKLVPVGFFPALPAGGVDEIEEFSAALRTLTCAALQAEGA